MVFRGRLGAPFVDFALRRARLLGLAGQVEGDEAEVRAVVEGAPPMIDVFEMACSLGPVEADVASWTRREAERG